MVSSRTQAVENKLKELERIGIAVMRASRLKRADLEKIDIVKVRESRITIENALPDIKELYESEVFECD